jgi:hypothetical protein
MTPATRWVLAAALVAALAAPRPALASILDTNIFCRFFGCIVVMTRNGTEIYLRNLVPSGSPTLLVSTQQRANPVAAVDTGTQNPPTPPGANEGLMLGIDQDGDGIPDLLATDDGDGFLDAGDLFGALPVTGSTQVVAGDISHSFYVASNVTFDLHARVRVASASGSVVAIGRDVSWSTSSSARGNDGGFPYGGLSTAAGFLPEPGIARIGDIFPGPTRVIRFVAPTRTGRGSIRRQLVRVTNVYGMPTYDLAAGDGELFLDVDYVVYRP